MSENLTPHQLLGVMAGALVLAALGIAAFLDWQEIQEKRAERHAKAYYDTWISPETEESQKEVFKGLR